jgi:hypothetical protein
MVENLRYELTQAAPKGSVFGTRTTDDVMQVIDLVQRDRDNDRFFAWEVAVERGRGYSYLSSDLGHTDPVEATTGKQRGSSILHLLAAVRPLLRPSRYS